MSAESFTFINATHSGVESLRQRQSMIPIPIGSFPPSGHLYQQQIPHPFMHTPPHGVVGHAAYPQINPSAIMNRGPSPNIHGVYSTYSVRLKNSDENALLLPSSYLTAKRPRITNESDDDYDDYEDSDDGGTPSSDIRTHASTVAIGNSGQNTVSVSHLGTPAELHKTVHKKSHIHHNQQDLERASNMEEVLVPIRLDIDLDDVKLRDVFLWNMNEQFLTPEKYAEIMCQDLELAPSKFVPLVADAIRTQVLDFEAVHEVELPPENIRVVINLDLQIGKINLRDRFEWDLENTTSNAPEVFSRQLASELGLGGEYTCIISHAIREQLYRHKRQWVDENLDDALAQPLSRAFRSLEDAESWAPQMEMLSNEELEKLLITQERNMRRLRRETRFKRSRRR